MEGKTCIDRWRIKDVWMDGQTDEQTDRWTDKQTDKQMDRRNSVEI